MPSIDLIKSPIKQDLEKFDEFFKAELKSSANLLDIITNYLLKQKGKQLRPILVMLAAKLVGEINKSTYSAAILIELMHTATLIHDDVVDISYKRRGLFSINALWKNKISVLVGDYFLAKGLIHAVNNKEFATLEICSQAVKEMSEGELLQIKKSQHLDIDEATYYKIIEQKTAALIIAAVKSGAASACDDKAKIEKISKLGEYIGMAFQIKDDIFDYQETNLIGKPTGNDIKEQKLTLPIIYVLENANKVERKYIMEIIETQNTNKVKVAELVRFVKDKGGIDYAEQKMLEYRNKALEVLAEFDDSEAKTSMIELVHYVTTRKK